MSILLTSPAIGQAVKVLGLFPDTTTSTAQYYINEGTSPVQSSHFNVGSSQVNVTQTFFKSGVFAPTPTSWLTLTVKHSSFEGGSLYLSGFQYQPVQNGPANAMSTPPKSGDDNASGLETPGSGILLSAADIAAIVVSSISCLALLVGGLVWMHYRILKKKEREWVQSHRDSVTVVQGLSLRHPLR